MGKMPVLRGKNFALKTKNPGLSQGFCYSFLSLCLCLVLNEYSFDKVNLAALNIYKEEACW